ncbi:hypothetical protein F0562_025066 [Nyssa sinensis]|uniref:Uncharacterized protein n=1 Tax=Nyssa sinensis TaxID=561372 RepID=A0A5J5BDF0_9ASTE|nr:hypothetical protein F0562_025066 [Nyssa sinensis]
MSLLSYIPRRISEDVNEDALNEGLQPITKTNSVKEKNKETISCMASEIKSKLVELKTKLKKESRDNDASGMLVAWSRWC